MKKIILLFAFLCASIAASWAQELEIMNFVSNITDITAQKNPVKDINGNDCALVRIKIATNNLIIDGPIKVDRKNQEFLAWISPLTRHIKIFDPENFFIPMSIDFRELMERYNLGGTKLESRVTYNLVLKMPERTGEVHLAVSNQYLAMTLEPRDANASIEIDGTICDNNLKNGFLQKAYEPGTYRYRISAKGYHTEEGEFTITKDQGATLKIELKPAFGTLLAYAKDDFGDMEGVEVLIDNEVVGTTPLPATGIKVDAGEVEVTLRKKLYKIHREKIRIEEGKTVIIDTKLIANYAHVTFKAPGDHEVDEGILQKDIQIWMDGMFLGYGVWEKDLEAGTYDNIELRINGYERKPQTITVEAGRDHTFNLIAPGKAYGVLHITCDLPDASVHIDGNLIGKTPLNLEYPAGEYKDFVVYDKAGYVIDQSSIIIGTKEETRKHITATEKTYQVGDYYADEKTGIDGVVIEVDNTGRHGKVVCLNDLGRLKWGPGSITIGCNDEADGEKNMKALELHLKEEYTEMTGAKMLEQMKRSYPAFGACKGLGEGWYLPSKMEMEKLLSGTATRKSDEKKISIRKAVNDTLKENGHNKIEAVPHWSSTEEGGHAAWIVSTAKQDINKNQKIMRFPVRAMARF